MSKAEESSAQSQPLQLRKLTVEQVEYLDELLASLGNYGEVHFIVQQGELRYINKVESFKAWKDDAKA